MHLRKHFIGLSLCLAMVTAQAEAATKSYIVDAARWGRAQADAVAQSGGRVVFSHDGAGLAVVESDSADFAARLKATGAVSSVDEDVVVQWQKPIMQVPFGEAGITPGDETFINLQWAPRAVEAPAAWAMGYEGAGVRVAVLDGGIHSPHVDIAPNLDVAASRSFVPGQPFNFDEKYDAAGNVVPDTFWHGTHVAGIIAAADNAIGTIGIAPKATIIGVKVLHRGSGSFGQIISGILYAASPRGPAGGGADIINMSLGAVFPKGGGNTGAGPLVAAMNKAVNYADRAGVLVVSAAGNDGLDLDHSGSVASVPAQSGSGIAVAATGPVGYAKGATDFRRTASYTNFGTSVINVAAPGGDFALPGNELCSIPRVPSGSVTNYCWVFDMVMSTTRGSGSSTASYGWAAGTSMAAPAAAAVAALVKQANPGISLGALKAKLLQSADDEGKPGADPYYGKGFVNARKAVLQ